jgi:hypothetical protein
LKVLPLIATAPSDETRVDVPPITIAESEADKLISGATTVTLLSLESRTAVSPTIDAISSVNN